MAFALILSLASIRALLPWSPAAAGLLSFPLVWAAGTHARSLMSRPGSSGLWLWHVSTAAATVVIAIVILMGFWGTTPARLLYGCTYAALSAHALACYLRSLIRETRGAVAGRSPGIGALTVYGAALTALLCSAALEVLAPRSPAASLVLVSAAVGYLGVCAYFVAQEGYLQGAGRGGCARGPAGSVPELRAARARAEQTESSLLLLDRLIAMSLVSAGTAHEFKGILSGILASGEHALRRSTDESVREALERILDHARQGERTVLRHLDEIVRHGREEAQAVDLRSALAEVLRLLRSTCRRRGVDLAVSIDEGVVVHARQGEIIQVLLNLARNALEALETGGDGGDAPRLSVRACRWEGEALLEIADNGPGIDAGQLGGLFEPGASGRESTGLGLYLSRMLVERNGGSLECVPVDRGGCFRISLPLAVDV